MPIYQCKPGSDSNEPWRHGVPVHELPFPIAGNITSSNNNDSGGVGGSGNKMSGHNTNQHSSFHHNQYSATNGGDKNPIREHEYEDDTTRYTTHNTHQTHPNNANSAAFTSSNDILPITNQNNSTNDNYDNNNMDLHTYDTFSNIRGVGSSPPIRRVKHAEIVLVDEVSIHFGNYWLRLRWPGKRGGVAGYIALGDANSNNLSKEVQELREKMKSSGGGVEGKEEGDNVVSLSVNLRRGASSAVAAVRKEISGGVMNTGKLVCVCVMIILCFSLLFKIFFPSYVVHNYSTCKN